MAKTRTVYSTQDDGAGTLRDALRITASYTSEWIDAGALENGDSIDFDDSLEVDGVITILLSSQLQLPAKILTIDGGAHTGSGATLATRVILDAQQLDRVIYGASANKVIIYNVTFKDGKLTGSSNTGAGVQMRNSTASGINVLEHCVFDTCSASSGGGLHSNSASQNSLTNCTFNECSANTGGGLYSSSSSRNTLSNCTFNKCSSTGSGGGLCSTTTSQNTLTNCVFDTCSAANTGGGLYAASSSQNTLTNCTFNECSANTGGGLYSTNTSRNTLINCVFIPPENNTIATIANYGTNTDGSLIINGSSTCDRVQFANNSTNVINGKLTADVLTISNGASVTFSGVDSILAVTTTATVNSATFTAAENSTGYLALPDGSPPPTVGTGVKTATYGAGIERASVSATVVSWTAETLSTPILIEQLSGDSWNTLTDSATGGTYSGTFGEGVTVRLFDGVNFYYASRPAPYWLVNSFAVNASNGWIVDASAVATNGGGGTDPVTGAPLPYWTITTDDITPNF